MPALPGPVGVVVGLAAEARFAAPLGGHVQAGGGTPAGAEAAVARLLACGVRALLSFGLAGGLDRALRPGAVIVPGSVIVPRPVMRDASAGGFGSENASGGYPDALPPFIGMPVDDALASRLGGSTGHRLLAGDVIVASAEEKRHLRETTGAAAVDLESGAVALAAARVGLPFAVLRVICDPAERTLPEAALAALDPAGGIRVLRIFGSIARRPRQIPGLLALASDAGTARRALIKRVAAVGQISTSS